MKNCRIIFCFCLLFLMGKNALSQVIVDSNVEKNYKEAVKKVPEEMQVVFKKKDESGLDKSMQEALSRLGIGIFTIYQVDTLNKKELSPIFRSGTIEISDFNSMGPVGGQKTATTETKTYAYSDGRNTYIPCFMTAVLTNDSLSVTLPWIFEPGISNVITPNSVSFTYWDYRKYDSVYRTSLQEPRKTEIRLPMQIIHFTISDRVFIKGKIIYGEAELTTPPFYIDDSAFTSGYIKQQLHFKYVFQLRITTPEEFK